MYGWELAYHNFEKDGNFAVLSNVDAEWAISKHLGFLEQI